MGKRKKSKKFINELCVYCGKTADTSDHIPPQCIFAEPKKEELLEVPSCSNCNGSFSMDDEYFKTALTIIEGVDENPDAKRVLESVHRSFSKPNKKGFTKGFSKTIKILPITSYSGLFTRIVPTFEFNKIRILNTASRIVQGLHWIEKKSPIPEGVEVKCFWTLDFMNDVKPSSQILRNLAGYVYSKPSKTTGSVFEYWVSFLEEYSETIPEKSIWLLRFYQRIDILCVCVNEKYVK